MFYNVHCMYVGMYILDFLKNIIKDVSKNIPNSAWLALALKD